MEEPREEAGHETHYGLRAPMPLPWGTRPTPLSVAAGPQRSDCGTRLWEAEKEEEELLAFPPQLRTPVEWAQLRELIGAASQARRRRGGRCLPLSGIISNDFGSFWN